MSDLDRQVAEALGERVCGGVLVYPKTYRPALTCSKCLASTGSGLHREGDVHLPAPLYSSSWEAAGRLVEEMRRRGYRIDLRVSASGAEVWAIWEREGWLESYAEASTLPSALARAALRALGERREG